MNKLQAAGEFMEATAKILADEITILLLCEGAAPKQPDEDAMAFGYHHGQCVRLLQGLTEMGRAMKA